MEQQQKILTFWDHLEELRHVLFRIAVAVVFLMLVAFLFKDELFAIVLAPKNADFIIYHFFCRIADRGSKTKCERFNMNCAEN